MPGSLVAHRPDVLRCLPVVVLLGCATACARQSAPSQEQASAPRQVTIVGCLERDEHGVILRGRDVSGALTTGIGRERGAVPSTQTLGGGDAARNARPATAFEARASMLTPRLESDDEADLMKRVGQRVLVRGEFEPAGIHRPDDTVKVQSIETVSSICGQP